MNFFNRNRFVSWLLVFLVVINLTALVTFLAFYMRKPARAENPACGTSCMALQKELSLTPGQSGKVDTILAVYRTATQPYVARIKDCRAQLLEELAKDKPDTGLISRCTDEINTCQKEMQKASVNQYLSLKKICTPDQCRRLSALYFELYGCRAGMGKGMMYRHGQGKQGCGNMTDSGSCGE
jgi:Spy/CpxP family protein refolding chaperone